MHETQLLPCAATCPFTLECGKKVADKELSCINNISDSIEGTYTLQYKNRNRVILKGVSGQIGSVSNGVVEPLN